MLGWGSRCWYLKAMNCKDGEISKLFNKKLRVSTHILYAIVLVHIVYCMDVENKMFLQSGLINNWICSKDFKR